MDLYMITRRGGWSTPADLEAAAERSTRVTEEMPKDVRWIRTYVLEEPAGDLGTMCVYEATGPDALREHARRADLPVDEIVRVGNTLVVHEDPAPAAN